MTAVITTNIATDRGPDRRNRAGFRESPRGRPVSYRRNRAVTPVLQVISASNPTCSGNRATNAQ